jgi:hypothetical protein
MAWKARFGAIHAAERRKEREAHKRQRDLEKQLREQEKLSAIEQARLEVESFENQVEILLSVHREPPDIYDWSAISALLRPPIPIRDTYHEIRTKQQLLLLPQEKRNDSQSSIEEAVLKDEEAFRNALEDYSRAKEEYEILRDFARRIRAGDCAAYLESLVQLNPFADISELGSSVQFTVHSTKLIEATLNVNGTQVIPAQVKTLTASGKLAVKPIPKKRCHEIYQDHVCGCALRVAREVFAILPVKAVLITAFVESPDARTGRTSAQPVLSVIMPRNVLATLDFDRLDPSDAMENFQHRGDLKASRKNEAFDSIVPLTVPDFTETLAEDMALDDFVHRMRKLHQEVKQHVANLSEGRTPEFSQTISSL